MEFLVIDSTRKQKPIAIIGKIGTEVGYMTTNNMVKRVLDVMLKKNELRFEKANGQEIVIDRWKKDSDRYLMGVGYNLEPPLKRHMVGTATVRDLRLGIEKLWKIYIGSTPPKDVYIV